MQKTLILRLSSLGDVVLSSAALGVGTPGAPPVQVDWVVAREFAPLLQGHPRIGRLWEFDRKSGFSGWMRLCSELAHQDYTEIIDLHGSLRTRLARIYFRFRASTAKYRWRKLPKQRWRLYGLYFFKNHWPASWRPVPCTQRFSQFVGGTGKEKPNLSHLVTAAQLEGDALPMPVATGSNYYYCVMPGSKWPGKCWDSAKYLEVIRNVSDGGVPVILGGKSDPGSQDLVERLNEIGYPHFSGVGLWDLRQVAQVISMATAYLGNDTGLAHLAEALGVPALVVYGPTTPSMGFGPWRAQSRTVGVSDLGCRPCGKDGRRCYRLKEKYLCMTALEASEVSRRFEEVRGKSR